MRAFDRHRCIVVLVIVAGGCGGRTRSTPAHATARSSIQSAADRPGCNDTSRRGSLGLLLRFRAAYNCMGFSPFELGCVNWRLQRWGYGCYTSERNLGLDVQWVDQIDKCGREHDLDWHAICQNQAALDGDQGNPRTTGCDCYLHTPALECDRSGRAPKLVVPAQAGESAKCKWLCGEELRKQATCFGQAIAGGQPQRKYRTPWTYSSGPACTPTYCLDRSLRAEHDFHSWFGPVVPPDNFDRPQPALPPCVQSGNPAAPPTRP